MCVLGGRPGGVGRGGGGGDSRGSNGRSNKRCRAFVMESKGKPMDSAIPQSKGWIEGGWGEFTSMTFLPCLLDGQLWHAVFNELAKSHCVPQ